MYSNAAPRRVNAPHPAVHRALAGAGAIAKRRAPARMSGRAHALDAREGGSFRASPAYDAPAGTGGSAPHTGTHRGHFAEPAPDERVAEVSDSETADPAFRGTMTMTTTLTGADGGTEALVTHEGIPDGAPAADNEAGTRMAPANPARLAEAGEPPRPTGDERPALRSRRPARANTLPAAALARGLVHELGGVADRDGARRSFPPPRRRTPRSTVTSVTTVGGTKPAG
jgi:hypothetical protein